MAQSLRIRLVHLAPQSYTESRVPTCTISSALLDSAPPYTALSYVWGAPENTTPILVDGKSQEVTLNLAAALEHLRQGLTTSLTLWIDALCIDQNDEAEKSEQVGRMRDIYAQAESVIAWLGDGVASGASATLAMDWIREYGGRAQKLGIGSKPHLLLRRVLERADLPPDLDGAASDCEERLFAEDLKRELSSENNPEYELWTQAMRCLLSLDYWSRVWIVQELTMARSAIFVCGNQIVDQGQLHHSLRLLRNFRLWQLVLLKLDTGAERPSLVREDSGMRKRVLQTDPSHPIDLLKIARAPGARPMMYLLRRLQRFRATDPRDRVFALLGIATDAEELGIVPDYSKTWQQIYNELARVLLRMGYFDVLSHCINEPHDSKYSKTTQTWVPDWNRPTTCSPLQQRAFDRSVRPALNTRLQPHYNACGSLPGLAVNSEAEASWNAPLSVNVLFIATVERLGDPWKTDDTVGAWLESLSNLARHLLKPSKASAVWRTAVADQDIRRHNEKPRLPKDTVEILERVFTLEKVRDVTAERLVEAKLGHYAEEMHSIGHGRRSFLTTTGMLSLGPVETREGDNVAVIPGSNVAYILRRVNDDSFLYIGEAYVDGAMDGELVGDGAVTEQIHLC